MAVQFTSSRHLSLTSIRMALKTALACMFEDFVYLHRIRNRKREECWAQFSISVYCGFKQIMQMVPSELKMVSSWRVNLLNSVHASIAAPAFAQTVKKCNCFKYLYLKFSTCSEFTKRNIFLDTYTKLCTEEWHAVMIVISSNTQYTCICIHIILKYTSRGQHTQILSCTL